MAGREPEGPRALPAPRGGQCQAEAHPPSSYQGTPALSGRPRPTFQAPPCIPGLIRPHANHL